MDAATAFLALVRENEGIGLDMNPMDPGNWTGNRIGVGELHGSKCGISAGAYPSLDIASLTDDAIMFLYRQDYLNRVGFDQLPVPIAIIIADCAINQGIGAAARILQQSLDVAVDGVIGPQTIAAAQRRGNNPGPVVDEIAARRALRYSATSGLLDFGLGWFRRLTRTYRAAIAA